MCVLMDYLGEDEQDSETIRRMGAFSSVCPIRMFGRHFWIADKSTRSRPRNVKIHRPEHEFEGLVDLKPSRTNTGDCGSRRRAGLDLIVSGSGNCSAIVSYNLWRLSNPRRQRSD